MTDGILAAVLAALGRRRDDAPTVRFDRVTVGDAAVLVELDGDAAGREADDDTRLAGLAHRPPGAVPEPAPWAESTPEAFAAAVVEAAAEPAGTDRGDAGSGRRRPPTVDGRLTRAVGIATLNALSRPYVSWRAGDPMALLDAAVETIVTVGLFAPAFRKFDDVSVRVIERDAVDDVPAPDGVDVRVFTPDETAAAMDGADVVFVTGSTLVYGGIERYLAAAPDAATVVCIGATASLLPDPLFDAGVDVVAGADVTDPEEARAAVAAGACGTDLHDRGVRKVYVTREPPADIHV